MHKLVQRGAYAAAGAGLTYHGAWDGSTNTPTLADGVGAAGDFYRVSVAGTQDLGSGPITFEVGDHVIYEGGVWQQLDPAQVVDWGDIQGTLANQADLQAALDAKADSADLPASANPSAQVGLTPQNGAAATFLRSDSAPALDRSIAPTWTGAHEFTAASTDTVPSIGITSANPQLDLHRTTAALDQKRWNLVADPTSLTLRALNDAGDTAANAWTVTRSGNNITGHSLLAGGAEAIGIAQSGEVTLAQDLHMSAKRVVNIADGSNPRDAVNKQQLDGKLDTTGGTITGTLNVTGEVISQSDVNAQRDVFGARFVSAAFAFSTPTDGTNTPDPSTNSVNIYGRDDGGQRLVAQWQDGTTNVIAQQGGGGTTDWGQIGGTLADQDDLNTALSSKADASDLTTHEGQQGVAGVHLPTGGTSGQVPVRGSGDTVAWQDPPSGGGGGQLSVHAYQNAPLVSLDGSSETVQLLSTFDAFQPSEVNLPSSGVATGKVFIIKHTTGNGQPVNLNGNGATIDGQTSISLPSAGQYRSVIYDGANWWVIGSS